MKKASALFVIVCTFNQLWAQGVFISQSTGGNWNAGTTWDHTGCVSGCTPGVDFPGAGDIAVVAVSSLNSVNINASGFAVKDLYVVNNVAGSIRKVGGFGTSTFTIHGQLSGANPSLDGSLLAPSVDVFQATAANLNIIFTGSNLDDPGAGSVITVWGNSSPIYRATFNPGSGNTVRVDNFSLRSSSTVQSGTLQVNTGQAIRDFSGTSVLTVDPGATINVFGAINGDGTTSSRFSTATVNGTVTTGSSGYFNSIAFTLGSAGIVNVGFNGGGNQTQGWWFQGNGPTSLNIASGSTVSYFANADQFVFASSTSPYGNLILSGGGTKTLNGSGLTIQNNLSIGSGVTFSPSTQVDFTGTATQLIGGTGTLNFNGGIEVNKSSGTVTLNKALNTAGIVVTAGTLSLGDVTTTMSSATVTVANGSSITSGTAGLLQISGTNSFSATGTGSTTLNNLTISSGTTTFNNSFSLTGNLINSGSLSISSTSTVTFTGGSNQAISGNAITIGNMVVNKTATTLNNNGNVELTGILTMTNGTFDADGGTQGTGTGNFVLNSDTNGDAAIGVMAGGSIVDEVTFERYFNNTTSNRWRNLAFPVTGVTFSELGGSITLSPTSLATYTESTLGNVDQGWNYVTSGTLNSAQGHTAWMVNNQPITISVKGPLLQNQPALAGSPYNFGVSYTNDPGQAASEDGWNFVPNPFASPIDWDNAGWVKTNLNTVVAVWDLEAGIYRYSGTPQWDGVIAQGQSFWVQTTAASPVLSCTEAVKVTDSNPTFYRQAAEQVVSRLSISLKSGPREDNTMIQFKDESTAEFDGAFDAYKLKNDIFNLSTLTSEGTSLAVNVLPKTSCPSSIKLNITNATPGVYELTFDGLQTFANLTSMVLVDQFTGNTQSLEEGATYSFKVTNDARSFGSERFLLATKFSDQTPDPVIQKEERKLISSYTEGNQWYLNDEPIEGAIGNNFTPSIRGVYYVVAQAGSCTVTSEKLTVEEGLARIFPNPVSTILKVDVQNLLKDGGSGEIFVHSVQGQLMRTDVFTDKDDVKEINVMGISPGAYIVTLVSKSGVILEKSKVIIK